MNLKQLKQIFQQKLIALYPKREIQSMVKLLVEHQLQWNLTQQILNEDADFNEKEIAFFELALIELTQFKPVQQIIGEAWFMEMPFKVNNKVLIPRPETEELVQLILDKNKLPNLIVADVCSGSGCIAIALAANLVNAEVMAYELSLEAIEIAKTNHQNLQPQSKIFWHNLDVLQAQFIFGNEDIIVSNPPYIPLNEADVMSNNVLQFEPHLALFTPNDKPLLFYEEILKQTLLFGKPCVQLFVECHENHIKNVANLFLNGGLKEVKIITDLQNKERMISAIKEC